MANSPQARKRAKQNDKQRAHNASLRSLVRTKMKQVLAAVNAGDHGPAQEAYNAAVPVIDRMANKGIIAVQRDELADVLSDYFEQSEQLATKFWLSTRAGSSAGLMLQQLPKQLVKDEDERLDQWQTLCALADTVTPDELIDTDTDHLLFKLFNEWDVQRFEPKRIRFSCNCSRDRSLNAIRLLPKHEITELFEEQQTVTMNCEMCGDSYHFTRNDVDQSEEPTIH